MSRAKVFISILTVLIFIALSGASVWAAPNPDEESISGVVEGIEIVTEVDPDTGDPITTVLVTLEDELGETQTVRVSVETAKAQGLLEVDDQGNLELDPDGNPIPIFIDPDDPPTVDIDSGDVITPPIRGDVQEIVIEVDEDGTVTVLVTLIDESGQIQTVRLSLETAIALGLVEVDENGDPIPIIIDPDNPPTVEIDPGDVIEEDGEEEEEGEEAQHPVASVLARFFESSLGLDYETVMGYHEEDGMGFGVIAQACWMASMLNDSDDPDAPEITPGDILEAKRAHDFASITLSDDIEGTPTNWGQFKNAVLRSEQVKKNLANLGAIMSERAEPPGGTDSGDEDEDENELGATSTQGKVKGQKDKAGGKPDTPPGQVKDTKDKDKGGGPPAKPPDKVKNKDKGKDKGGGKKN